MNIRKLVAAISIATAGIFTIVLPSTPAHASVSFLYPDPGHTNHAKYNFIAPSSGDVIAYFYGEDAGYHEKIGLLVNGHFTGITGLENHSSAFGDSLDLGYASAGDRLVFFLYVYDTNEVFFSRRHRNFDHFQHIYSTPFAGEGLIPAGTYISFEDLRRGGDKDYNDMAFVFAVSAVPELSTWVMMLLGFAGIGFVAFRKSRPQIALAPKNTKRCTVLPVASNAWFIAVNGRRVAGPFATNSAAWEWFDASY